MTGETFDYRVNFARSETTQNFGVAGQCTISAACECWVAALACSGLGFLLGLPLMGVSDNQGGHYSGYGFEFSASILAGRAYSPKPEPPRLPLLPKAVLVAFISFASFTVFVLLNSPKLCSGFVAQHLLFFLGWFVCGTSTTTWLIKASEFQRLAERETKTRLEEFLTDSSAPVPKRIHRPRLLTLWNYSNLALFSFVMIANTVSALSVRSGP